LCTLKARFISVTWHQWFIAAPQDKFVILLQQLQVATTLSMAAVFVIRSTKSAIYTRIYAVEYKAKLFAGYALNVNREIRAGD